MLLVTAVSLYLIAPSILEVFASCDQLADLRPRWLGLVGICQLASLAALWALQRLALRAKRWFPVITSQLAGNAASRVVPGGPATGAAVQFHLLRTARVDTARATSGLAAAGLLQLGTTLALPVVALPAAVLGAPASPELISAAWLGAGLFVVLFAVVTTGLRNDWPLRLAGRGVDIVRARFPGVKPAERATSEVLLEERDALVDGLEGRWLRAALLAVARAAFDYLSLLTALTAFGVQARPSLVLLAYASSSLLSLVPLTPGGLGFVEAGLTGTLALAGVPPSDAVAATLLYRLFSFWLPIPVGLLAGLANRLRYG